MKEPTKEGLTDLSDANENIGFVLGIDHQLRGPLNSLMGMIDFLKNTPLSAAQTSYVRNIESATNDLFRVLDQLQKLIAARMPDTTLKEEIFHVSNLVSNVNLLLTQVYKITGRSLEIEVDNRVPDLLSGDEDALAEIITGIAQFLLLSGNENIECKVKLTQKSGATFYLTISFNQPSLRLNRKQIIQALENPSHESVKGINRQAGMSLFLAKSLLKKFDSELEFDINKGGLTLKAYVYAKEPAAESRSLLSDGSVRHVDKELRVLVVEDVELNQIVTKMMLENYGYVVDIASNGQEAVQLFDPKLHECILMDIEMPVMDGIEATRQIREAHGNLVPIIGLSANALGEELSKYHTLGFDDYLTKPVKKELLASKVQHWMMKKSETA
ncbi:MAG: hypothetical protein Kow0075_09850 [Salibacteraceae bacterium]